MNITVEKSGIVNRVQNSIFGYQGWPSVTSDENGNLYAVASSFRCRHVCPFGKTAMFISRDGGATWTPPIVINDTYLDDRDAGIIYAGCGRLIVTWFSHSVEAYLKRYYQGIKNSTSPIECGAVVGMLSAYPFIPEEFAGGGSFIRVSEDYGVTWSDTVRIPISAPHGPTVCKDNSLIYLGKEMYAGDGETPEVIALYTSGDGGYTWNKRSQLDKPDGLVWNNFHEPHVVELDDGTLYGVIRGEGNGVPYGFTIYDTRSSDGGVTWTPWRCLNICGSPPQLLRHSSGKLVMVFGRRTSPCGERAVISEDCGRTWSEEYTLIEACDGDLGYPCSAELPDGSIVTVYYQKYVGENGQADDKPSIMYTKWHIS